MESHQLEAGLCYIASACLSKQNKCRLQVQIVQNCSILQSCWFTRDECNYGIWKKMNLKERPDNISKLIKKFSGFHSFIHLSIWTYT